MALPPWHHEHMARHHATQILAAFLDEEEWHEANAKAEKGEEAASISRDGRLSLVDVAGTSWGKLRAGEQAAAAFRRAGTERAHRREGEHADTGVASAAAAKLLARRPKE